MNTTTRSPNGAHEKLWDSVIIGGGAAGLAAGIVLARARFATLIVDGGEPRNGPADHMHGYPTRDGMAPKEFLATGRAEFTRYDGTLVSGAVTDARRAEDGVFELQLADGSSLRAASVLVATGLTDELPDIPGLAQGWATDVHHCPHCHGYEVRDRDIVVIGSAMTAVSLHLAALMRRYSASVTFCVNGVEVSPAERRRLTAYGVRLLDAPVTRVGDDCHSPVVVELADGDRLACDAIFVAPRPVPHDRILTTLGAAKDPASGLIVVDAQGATGVAGLWAAGNVVNPRAQVVTAAGAGSTAAIAMTGWLLEREMSAAVAEIETAAGDAS